MKKPIQSIYKLLSVVSKKTSMISIRINEGGTLAHKIASRRKYEIESLKIIGCINLKDIQYLCDMAGSKSSKLLQGKLSTLDLSEAEFSGANSNFEKAETHTFPAYLFRNCTILQKVIIPKTLVSIDRNTFYGCSKLTNIIVPEENKYYTDINGVLFNKNKDTLLFYPKGKAGSYTIPNNITTLKSSIFQDCMQLTSIVIPSSVALIEENAFSGCNHLKEIVCLSSQPAQCNNLSCFDRVSKSSCTLHVPKGSYSSYWLAQPWGDFTTIKEGIQ